MKFITDKILKALEEAKPLFEKGGRFEKLYPLYEAKDSFLFTIDESTPSAPHVRDPVDFKRIMITVIIALIPCVIFGAFNAGYQAYQARGIIAGPFDYFLTGFTIIMPIILVSYVVGGMWEALFAIVRRHEINEGFLVTGLLFPLVLPPTTPLWLVAIGVSFGVVLGKEVFGGTGMNILNPALLARAFIFFAYPSAISGDEVWIFTENTFLTGLLPWMAPFAGSVVDAVTQASPLAVIAAGAPGGEASVIFEAQGVSWFESFIGLIPGSIGETSFVACMMGAGILLVTGIASWRIMLSMILGMAAISILFNILAGENSVALMTMPLCWHLVTGGFAFGMVYMATDPVSAANTNTGRWIYGAFIGVLIGIVRVTNPAYVEGTMLAILFMNVFAPLIDYFVIQANIRRRKLIYSKSG